MSACKKQKVDAGRDWTCSLALPGSILTNVHTLEQKTSLASQVARAAAIFSIDEIIIFDDFNELKLSDTNEFVSTGDNGNNALLLANLLEYAECPQYLRKALFPLSKEYKFASLMHPLATPHHMLISDYSLYREGVTLGISCTDTGNTFVNCGTGYDCLVDKKLKPGIRVTVKLKKPNSRKGVLVPPAEPRTEEGIYWGYRTTRARCLSDIFKSSVFDIDLVLGTSERGSSIYDFTLPKFNHMLIVFGGVNGLEHAVDNDTSVNSIEDVFPHYLNICPEQTSRTIRTEEAIFIGLSALKFKITSSFSS